MDMDDFKSFIIRYRGVKVDMKTEAIIGILKMMRSTTFVLLTECSATFSILRIMEQKLMISITSLVTQFRALNSVKK